MEIVLHVGAHRTGSTAFQRLLGGNRDALAPMHIGYWGPRRTRAGLLRGLGDDGWGTPPWKARKARERIEAAMVAEAGRGTRTLVVSDENILGIMADQIIGQTLYPHALGRVGALVSGLGSRPLTIAIAIRAYHTWWASLLAVHVARGAPMPPGALMAALVAQTRRWRDVISDLATVAPSSRIVVWTHDDMADRPDVILGGLVARTPRTAQTPGRVNAARGAARLRRELADRGEDPSQLPLNDGQFMPFDAGQREILQRRYAEDLAWLASAGGDRITFMDRPGNTPADKSY